MEVTIDQSLADLMNESNDTCVKDAVVSRFGAGLARLQQGIRAFQNSHAFEFLLNILIFPTTLFVISVVLGVDFIALVRASNL
jgi:hypothetical protein